MANRPTEGTPARGWVVFIPVNINAFKSKGGIFMPTSTAEDRLAPIRTWYGYVVVCGQACNRQGDPSPNSGFPLPEGTIIEHTRPFAWQLPDGVLKAVLQEDVRRWWLPGTEPTFWATAVGSGDRQPQAQAA